MEENKNQEIVEETVEETAETETVAEETLEGNVDAETAEAENADAESEEIEDAVEGAEKSTKEKSKLFKKKKDPKDERIEELSDKLLRQMAEFDNFRKRTEKEKSAMYEIGAKDIIEKLLPVVDNFERGFLTVAEEDKEDAFVTGMEMVYKQLMTMLETVGVNPIEAVGKEFNPDLHNAVMHVEDETVGDNIIVEEFQKGYTYRDSVVRYSMVKVAN
ncbi:MAG: nucleotide exchange factor GrpE [Tyzzerella sp.]|nr:nucleotide exchange factor GrpE [Tyzzerella sp.]